MADNRIIASFTYRHEAEYAQGFLKDAGIDSLLLTDDVGGLHPAMGFSHSARVAVHADDADEAIGVLKDAGVI